MEKIDDPLQNKLGTLSQNIGLNNEHVTDRSGDDTSPSGDHLLFHEYSNL